MSEVIQVYCRTNLDEYKSEEWPREFACRPLVGDRVVAQSGKILWIVSITHETQDLTTLSGRGGGPMKNHGAVRTPRLLVELHKIDCVPRSRP